MNILTDNYQQKDWSTPLLPPKKMIGHTKNVMALIQLRNGTLVSGSEDRAIILWNLETKKALQILRGHEGTVKAVVELAGNRLASASFDGTIKLWDLLQGRNISTIRAHNDKVMSLVLLSEDTLASCSFDKTIKFWNWTDENQPFVATLEGHLGVVSALIRLRDGHLASGSADRTIKIWNAETRNCLQTFDMGGHVYTLLELSDNNFAVSLVEPGVRIWSLATRAFVKNYLWPHGYITSVTELKNGKLACSLNTHEINILDRESNADISVLREVLPGGLLLRVCQVVIELHDGRLACDGGDSISLWDARSINNAPLPPAPKE